VDASSPKPESPAPLKIDTASKPHSSRPSEASQQPISAPASRPVAAPPLAVAPFDAPAAQSHREAWAKYLGVPVETTNGIGMKMALIPAGEFMMGAAEGESHKAARPQHRVRITQPFYLGIYPVTQAEYQRMMGKNPSRFQGWKGILGLFASPPEPRRPVEQVWWESAVEFCRRLSEQEGVTYRLPTEAEWEYACRAGSVGRWCFGDDESSLEQYAWYTKNSGDSAHPVGRKKPNAWGLYDMHGNVLEWCEDWYGNDYYRQFADKVAVDPAGPLGGSTRVLRGGSWWDGASYCRSACRFRGDRGPLRFDHLGFRLARTVAAPPLAVAPFDVSAAQRYRQWLEKDLAELYASRPRKFHALTYQQWLVEYLAELNAANKSILVDSASATAKTPPAAATQAGNQSTGKPESSRGTYAASS
jgi:formylglycine-generating enzyme required for sulfatase activity